MNSTSAIGFVASYKSGLTALRKAGQDQRLLEKYAKPYLKEFETIYYFSYFSEDIADFTPDPELRQRFKVLPKRWNVPAVLYGFLMPLAYRNEFWQCTVFRVFQATGILPLLGPWAQGMKCLVTFGYDYAQFAQVEGKAFWEVWALTLLERAAAWRATVALVTTHTLADKLRAWRKDRPVELIPNGVDIEQFRVRENDRPREATKTILFIGRLEKQKNLENLIRGAAQVHKDVPIRLLWIGEGTQKDNLTTLARDHDLPLVIRPPVPHQQLPDVMKSADVFALVSHIEGHPKILLEAMSSGLPCVVSECEGNRDLAAGGTTAFTCPPNDVQAIAQALITALTKPGVSLEKGVNARRMIEERFNLTRNVQEEINVVRHLTTTPRAPNLFFHLSFIFLSVAFLGNILADKTFSYIGISLSNQPLYITDMMLALSFATLVLSGRASIPRVPGKWFLVLLLGSSFVSFFRGLIIYGAGNAMRDVMMIGYLLAGYLTCELLTRFDELSPRFVRLMTHVAVIVAGLRLAGAFGNTLCSADLSLQPACTAIYASAFLILALHAKPSLYSMGAQVMLIALGILISVRSAWLAWGLIGVTVTAVRMTPVFIPNPRRFLLKVLPSGVLLALLSVWATPQMYQSTLLTDLETLLVPIHGFSGSSMANVRTRYWMWQSAFEEISRGTSSEQQSQSKVVSAAFKDRTSKMESANPAVVDKITFVSNLKLWDSAQKDPLSGWSKIPLEPGLKNSMVTLSRSPWFRILFGFPMGKLFIPPRISYWLDVPRYDPHNSLIAVLYRTGVLGLVGFLGFLLSVLSMTLRNIRAGPVGSLAYRIWIFGFMFTLYIVFHMLTDVVLESPFKSIFFWGALGLCLIPPASKEER